MIQDVCHNRLHTSSTNLAFSLYLLFAGARSSLAAVGQGGSGLDDNAKAIAATGDGHVVLAGFTNGDFSGQNAGDETADFVAVKLNGTDGSEVWRWQVRSLRPCSGELGDGGTAG